MNTTALSHGLLLFQKALRFYGIETIQIFQEEKPVSAFFTENYSRMSIEFKYSTFASPITEVKDLLSRILRNRNFLLEKLNYENSVMTTPSEVFEVLYLQLAMPETPVKDDEPELSASFNLRKSPSSLSSRSISNISEEVISSIDEKIGVENSLVFLKSAFRVLYKNANILRVKVRKMRISRERARFQKYYY